MRSAGIACIVANSHTISSGSQLATIGAIRGCSLWAMEMQCGVQGVARIVVRVTL
jgi:hypothetical protein